LVFRGLAGVDGASSAVGVSVSEAVIAACPSLLVTLFAGGDLWY